MFFWDLGSSVRENNETLTRKYEDYGSGQYYGEK